MKTKLNNWIIRSILMLACAVGTASCSDEDSIPMQVMLTRSVSKLPFVIALDQGLYEKYGLDLEVRMEPPEFDGGIHLPSKSMMARIWREIRRLANQEEIWEPNIWVSGANGRIFDIGSNASAPHPVFIAATDCVVRAHIVGSREVNRLEDLKGKRLGVSSTRSNSGFIALLLAERMGWDPIQDISIMSRGNNIDALRNGQVDAFVASERAYVVALQEGYPVLAETSTWNEPIAGNSVRVEGAWLEDPRHREAARRFLQATIEGIALLHQDHDLVLDVLAKWHGIIDSADAEKVYAAGRWIPRKPYPCYAGIAKAMQRYDSNEIRKYEPQDFYDDSLVRELDESGFIDGLYAAPDLSH